MPEQLFTHYFLSYGIRATTEWKASVAKPEAFAAFRDGICSRYEAFATFHDPNEAVTEQELIRPVLELLGWMDYLPQQGMIRNEDVPDLLLFSDPEAKERAAKNVSPMNATMTPRLSKKTNDSGCRWTPVAETTELRPEPRTARFLDIFRRPRLFQTAEFDGAS